MSELFNASWLTSLHTQLLHRNDQIKSSKLIYDAYETLFQEYAAQEEQRTSMRHKLTLLEHELNELCSKGESAQALALVKRKLSSLQTDLTSPSDTPNEQLFHLSKVLLDQRKLVKHLQEEAELAKVEHRNALERQAALEEQLKKAIASTEESKKSIEDNAKS
jgi:hypothetical protein